MSISGSGGSCRGILSGLFVSWKGHAKRGLLGACFLLSSCLMNSWPSSSASTCSGSSWWKAPGDHFGMSAIVNSASVMVLETMPTPSVSTVLTRWHGSPLWGSSHGFCL